jgi:hypothetical protein
MKRFFKRLYLKYLLWIRNTQFLKPEIEIDPHENIHANICRKLMAKPNTKLSLAPLSEKRYIINEELGMFIIIEPYSRTIELTNHVYHYSVKMNEKTFNSIKHVFDNKLEAIRLKYENEIKDQIQHSLHVVLDKLNK